MTTTLTRRRLIAAAGAVGAAVAFPALAQTLPRMTEGPFYPSAAWRTKQRRDWDADLTQIDGVVGRRARGEHLGLELAIADAAGRPVDRAEVEIWQCDVLGAYRHPSIDAVPGQFDDAFQGFGEARGASDGTVRFRTIRPAPYPGRTPHIHLRLRHATFGELTSQLFVAGEPRNELDGLWRRLGEPQQKALAMQLVPGSGDLRWQVRHAIVVPA